VIPQPSSSANVVSLHGRNAYKPDFAALARQQISAARLASGAPSEDFASLLSSMVGWPVGLDALHAWETTAVPPGDVTMAAELISRQSHRGIESDPQDPMAQIVGDQFADVTAVFGSRSEFQAKMPTTDLLDTARSIKACGLSLNMICQTYSEARLLEIIEAGTTVQCLFLKPYGQFIADREKEEGYPEGHLSALTAMNMTILSERVAKRLSPSAAERLQFAAYDEPVRFNVLLIDDVLCVAQPYLPEIRGVDSPTLVIRKRRSSGGLYKTFELLFSSMWERSERD
jgi:Domain of unknown function (DUF5919)